MTVHRMLRDHLLSAYQIRAGKRAPWRIEYDSVVAYCNRLRVHHFISEDRLLRTPKQGRLRDEDLLPFPTEQTIDASEVMRRLGISRETVTGLIQAGHIVGYQILIETKSCPWRIYAPSLDRYLASLHAEAKTSPRMRQAHASRRSARRAASYHHARVPSKSGLARSLPNPMSLATTTVSSTNLCDATGTPIVSATIQFQPVLSNGLFTSFKYGGSTGGQASSKPVSTQVVNGAFSIVLADTAQTFPINIGYAVTCTDKATGYVHLSPKQGYGCFQPTGSAVNFDEVDPNLAPQVTVQTGPTGATGAGVSLVIATHTFSAAGSATLTHNLNTMTPIVTAFASGCRKYLLTPLNANQFTVTAAGPGTITVMYAVTNIFISTTSTLTIATTSLMATTSTLTVNLGALTSTTSTLTVA
jgi:hypothetical protein